LHRGTADGRARPAGGAVRGKVKRTTICDPKARKPLDLVDRNFRPLAPDRLWVADFTYCSTWSGWCYTAFVIDAYARRILGWSVATSMTARFVVDAVEQAIWTRGREGRDLAGLIAHHDHGVQYLSVAYSEHLATAGIKPSTGAVGSSHDNALAESVIGLYKTELIKPRRPSKGLDDLEIATAEWVDWFNYRRPFEYCDDLTPIEAERAHYAHHQAPANAGASNYKISGLAGTVQGVSGPGGLSVNVHAAHVDPAWFRLDRPGRKSGCRRRRVPLSWT